MGISSLIKNHNVDFVSICSSHRVGRLYAFGSSVTKSFDPEASDVDLIVKIEIEDPVIRGQTLLSLWDKLESFFDRKVDLLTEESIRNPYLKASIDRTKKLIYDRE